VIKKLILALLLLPSICFGADYHIGPGQTYTTIGAFDWRSLVAGDHVYIHYDTYSEMIHLSRSGTEANPIIIEGVPDGNGNLPIIDGTNMVMPSQYDGHLAEYDLGGGQLAQAMGLVFIYRSTQDAFTYVPEWIEVKNLEVHSRASEVDQFTNTNGVVQYYPGSGACIYVKTGRNILVENNIMHDCGNGFDVQGVDVPAENITLRGNYIYGNGSTVSGREDREHNIYVEGYNTVIEYNYIGPIKNGAEGIGLKDRSIGATIRYNYITAGARTIDLVGTQNIVDSGVTDACDDSNYGSDWVYGNIVVTDENIPGSTSYTLIHYGQDSTECPRNGGLQVFNNTFYYNHSGNYHNRILDIDPIASINLYNNVFWIDNHSYGVIGFGFYSLDTNVGDYNWLGGNAIYTPDGYSDMYPGYTGTWNEAVAIIEGDTDTVTLFNDPSNGDFSIAADSPLINAGVTLPTSITDVHPVSLQYLDPRSYEARADTDDIGAFAYDGSAPVPTCSDGIQNQDETGVDCGGSCDPCSQSGGYHRIAAGYTPIISGSTPIIVQ
jgi:hypothetical protein